METKDYRKLFLEKSLLGQNTNFDSPEEVVFKCIKLAYNDMMSSGRYYLLNDEKINKNTRCKNLKKIIEKNNYTYSRNIIEEALILFGDKEEIRNNKFNNRLVTRYGLAQKFVNMTFKYFYVFKDYIKKEIDFSVCDCPLDSVILKKIPELKNYTWSKLTKDEYEYCQQIITGCMQEENYKDFRLLGSSGEE